MRLTVNHQKAMFLDICKNNAYVCGIDIVALSKGLIPKGTVYAAAASLEHDGLISSELEKTTQSGQISKRLYKITPEGMEILAIYKKLMMKQNEAPPTQVLVPA